jgi:hypothetical protein
MKAETDCALSCSLPHCKITEKGLSTLKAFNVHVFVYKRWKHCFSTEERSLLLILAGSGPSRQREEFAKVPGGGRTGEFWKEQGHVNVIYWFRKCLQDRTGSEREL